MKKAGFKIVDVIQCLKKSLCLRKIYIHKKIERVRDKYYYQLLFNKHGEAPAHYGRRRMYNTQWLPSKGL